MRWGCPPAIIVVCPAVCLVWLAGVPVWRVIPLRYRREPVALEGFGVRTLLTSTSRTYFLERSDELSINC